MKIIKTAVALTIGALFAAPTFAQDVDDVIQRNARQQERIEQGLRTGDLTVQEGAALERRAGRIEGYQSRALADGTLSQDEARRIDRAQDRFGREISRQAHDDQTGDPNSRSAQRMAAAADRNGDEQRRIAQGVRSGDLTNREAARLQQGQAYLNRNQARAGADGHVGRYEQRGIQYAQNQQSQNIWRERHDGQRGDQGGSGSRYAQGRDAPGYNAPQRGWQDRASSGDRGWQAPRYAQNGDHPGYSGQHRGWGDRASAGGNGYQQQARTEARQVNVSRSVAPAGAGTRERRR
jgi:hypothetical protein